MSVGLQDLAEGMAVSQDQVGLRRLQTFQHVKEALEQGLPSSELKPSGSIIGELAGRFKSFAGPTLATATTQRHSEEKAALLEEFSRQTGGSSLVRLPTFKAIMDVRGNEFAERLFKALDAKCMGSVTSEQLVDTLLALKSGTVQEKIAFIWSFTASDEGHITRDELQALLRASCSEGGLSVDSTALEKLSASFFAKAGKADADTLLLEDFILVLNSRPEICQSIQFGGLNLGPTEVDGELAKAIASLSFGDRASWKFLRAFRVKNIKLTAWLVLFIAAQLAGFVAGFLRNDSGNYFDVLGYSYPVAKGAAGAIQVVVIVFPFTVARSVLTYLRETPLRHILPLDDHLISHRQLAYHFFIWSCIHTFSHFVNGARSADPSRHNLRDPNAEPKLESQATFYSQEVSITGIVMIGIMCIGYFYAMPWPRNSWLAGKLKAPKWMNRFEVFYFTHIFMALVVLVLLILHPLPGPAVNPRPHRSTTWVYMVAGVAVYILERMVRILRRALWDTAVIGVALHSGGVTELRLQKPVSRHTGFRTFSGKAGQYCYLNIPELSRYQWHPFSLTSGPGDDFISFHIRSAGDWSKALYKRCDKTLSEPAISDPLELTVDKNSALHAGVCGLAKSLVVNVDGPYGAPAQDHSMFSCLLLVGAGIGVTPFASVLRQLLDEYNKSVCECCKTVNRTLFKPRKVYFFWMTREQSAPQYFYSTLESIKALDQSDFLEINIYLTAALPNNDLRTTIAKVAQVIQHEEDGYDAYTGTYQPAPCYFGRPDWPATLSKISKENQGARVGVFVCGPPVLSKELKGSCLAFNKSSGSLNEKQQKTNFIFHKENF